jgi:hypothetical protein
MDPQEDDFEEEMPMDGMDPETDAIIRSISSGKMSAHKKMQF